MFAKLRVGIIFGGQSREREISFRGGKTAYEHLDKSLFEPVLIFVDSMGNFILLNDAKFLYENSIRDFYPSKNLNRGFRVYIESLGKLNSNQLYKLIYKIGKQIRPEELVEHIDFAFNILHGPFAEDGNIQGLFEWYGIPYMGPGQLGSAVGINKAFQNQLLNLGTGQEKKSMTISKKTWENADRSELFSSLIQQMGFPLVIKAPHQGSSIGVAIVKKRSLEEFSKCMSQCFFESSITAKDWQKMSSRQKKNLMEKTSNLNEGIGFPISFDNEIFEHPADFQNKLDQYLAKNEIARFESINSEDFVLLEEFVEGQEFSIGVIQDDDQNCYALPPTEIYGEIQSFDFKSKYQSNVTKKRIPVETHIQNLKTIEQKAIQAFKICGMQVVCRIDGFLTLNDEVIMHDPNTVPGMSPTSLIFKQMAEIGLNITNAISYLIRQSIVARTSSGKNTASLKKLLSRFDQNLDISLNQLSKKVAVIFAEDAEEYANAQKTYNQYSAAAGYLPTCICHAKNGSYYRIPMPLMYKTDIEEFGSQIGREKHPFVQSLIDKTTTIRSKFAGESNFSVNKISIEDIRNNFELVHSCKTDELINI